MTPKVGDHYRRIVPAEGWCVEEGDVIELVDAPRHTVCTFRFKIVERADPSMECALRISLGRRSADPATVLESELAKRYELVDVEFSLEAWVDKVRSTA